MPNETKASHTPGRWNLTIRNNGTVWLETTASERTVFDTEAIDVFPISDADRALIQAAPDLLEACKGLAEFHGGQCDSCGCAIDPNVGNCGCEPPADPVMNERKCKARLAIARAEGGAA